MEGTRVDAGRLATELARVRASLATGRAGHEAAVGGVRAREVAVRELRKRAEAATQAAGEAALTAREQALELAHLEEQTRERCQAELKHELFRFHLEKPPTGADREKLDELKGQAERMGGINLTAIEEYDELAKRHAFMTAQKADLEASGFKVVTKQAPWSPDYLDQVDAGNAQMYLLGWTGDFGDPDNFVGTFFQAKSPQFGFTNKEIFDLLDRGEAEADQAKRTEIYKEANDKIMAFLPGLPYAHTEPALAFKATVKGFVPSPVTNEDFNTVSIAGS